MTQTEMNALKRAYAKTGGVIDGLDCVIARVRLIELALLGAGKSGMSLDDETYIDALTQQTQDVLRQLDALSKTLENPLGAPADAT